LRCIYACNMIQCLLQRANLLLKIAFRGRYYVDNG